MAYCHDRGMPHSELLEWSAEDRAKLFAYIAEQAEVCQMCGTARWQWDEDPYAFEPVREVCFGCQKKDVLRDDHEKMPPGASIVLITREEARRRRQAARPARRSDD